ncbi:hypothetical protein QVD17_18285 [Tagetes erecta]|uniref:Uncharacterized protein n=1 Tax=Tagetes erecta TaxID=13708 RepID=A0AAD8KHA1_TARER|nr:hypothetical protein QVD17_18285 [Tagetes erecta]
MVSRQPSTIPQVQNTPFTLFYLPIHNNHHHHLQPIYQRLCFTSVRFCRFTLRRHTSPPATHTHIRSDLGFESSNQTFISQVSFSCLIRGY